MSPLSSGKVGPETWTAFAGHFAEGSLTLAGLWGDDGAVHLAALDERGGDEGAASLAVLTLDCPDRRFPAVSPIHPAAIRLERAARDLFGLEPVGLPDPRPWLKHEVHPGAPYSFLPAQGEGLHQIPVGPVHAGIIEPGHFRFTVHGETVVRLEERLGYAHKGVESLLAGSALDPAARLAGRISGDSTVATSYAFARAVEAALGAAPPQRAVWLRALMAELERLANHFGDIGAICNDAAFPVLQAQCAVLREWVLRAAAASFGHRLMMDRVLPGGVAADLSHDGGLALRLLTGRLRQRFRPLVALYDETASLQDRTVGTGVVKPDLARRFGCGGVIGRASGRAFDARRTLPYPPYDRLRFEVPVLQEGDVNARVWVRIREVEQSLALVEQILDGLPEGDIRSPLPTGTGAGEGTALVEGFRGDILCWVALDGEGRIRRCHLRDPSWFQWPLLEGAIEGNIVADFPLCNKSFNCSYSGHDL